MKRFVLPLLFASLFLAIPASAATFRAGENVVLASPVTDDLYIQGSNVSVRQNVNGDLLVAGGKIDVENAVAGDLTLLGGNVTVMSQVGDDVRVAGGELTIRGTVNGDLFVAGGTVTIGKDAVILGNAYIAGGTVTIRGAIGKNAVVRGGTVMLQGVMHGSVDARGGNLVVAGPIEGDAVLSADRLDVAQGGSFRGAVTYWAGNRPVKFGTSLASGQQASFQPSLIAGAHRGEGKVAEGIAAVLGVFAVLSLLSAMLVMGLLVFISKTFFTEAAKRVQQKPAVSFLLGLAWFIIMPVAVFLLMLTIIGIPLGLLALAAYFFMLFFAVPLTSLVLARWLERANEWEWNKLSFFGASVGVYVVLRLIGIVPVVGWITKGVLVLLALGALLMTKWNRVKKIL
jgi:cytoskeletal protein CcmA (bactofilin family)